MKFLKEMKSNSEKIIKSNSLEVKVLFYSEEQSKKWLGWSLKKNPIEQWILPFRFSSTGTINDKEIRNNCRLYQREIAKEALKQFEHFIEGYPEQYEITMTIN